MPALAIFTPYVSKTKKNLFYYFQANKIKYKPLQTDSIKDPKAKQVKRKFLPFLEVDDNTLVLNLVYIVRSSLVAF